MEMFTNQMIGVCILDDNGKLLNVNKEFTKLTGYDYKDIKKNDDYFPLVYSDENYKADIRNDWNDFIKSNNDINEFVITCKNGMNKDIEFRKLIIKYNLNVIILIDITESNKLKKELKENVNHLKNIISSIPEIVLILDESGKYVDVWTSEHKNLIKPSDELIGRNIDEFLPKSVSKKYHEKIKVAIVTNEMVEFDYFLKIDNKKKYFNATLEFFDLDKNKKNILVVIRDVTDYTETKNILKSTKNKLELVINIANLGIWEQDIDTKKTGYCKNCSKMLGYEYQEIAGTAKEWEETIHKDDKEDVLKEINAYINGEIPIFKKKYRLMKKDGSYKWIYDIGKIVSRNRSGKPTKLIGIHLDIDESMKTQEKIEYLSFRDGLTDLYNRRYFENELERISNSRKLPIAIIIGDMDRLKFINDTYGHRIGDKYLIIISEILKRVTRKSEIVSRIGGDEFAVISEANIEDAKLLLERIKNEIEKFNEKSDLPENLSISLGYACKLSIDENVNDVFINADLAMYKEKNQNRKMRK
jgi:diguanylate cyclase (GGDEF)-like protein/PAS domain S-box-containing protein